MQHDSTETESSRQDRTLMEILLGRALTLVRGNDGPQALLRYHLACARELAEVGAAIQQDTRTIAGGVR